MSDHQPYVDLARYPLDADVRDALFAQQIECSLAWSTRDGWPVGVVHWFVWHDDRFWVTSTSERKRVRALRQRPESSVIVSSVGTDLGPNRSVTAKTLATVHEDDTTNAWFFPALAAKAFPDHRGRAHRFEQMLFETSRVAIELTPTAFISYDGLKMAADVAGSS